MIPLEAAAAFVRLHRGKDGVIKVGRACLERDGLRRAIARQIAVVEACGARPVIVHGGGPQTDRLQRALGEEPRKVLGRRVTSTLALRALTMATRGELNSEVCAALLAEGQGRRPGGERLRACRPPAAGLDARGPDRLRRGRRHLRRGRGADPRPAAGGLHPRDLPAGRRLGRRGAERQRRSARGPRRRRARGCEARAVHRRA